MDSSRAAVLRKVASHFPAEDTEEVLALLDTYEPSSGGPPHRVHLAILKLSDGDTEAVRQYLSLAEVDYRDVIASAEYPAQMRIGPNATPEAKQVAEAADREQYRRWLER